MAESKPATQRELIFVLLGSVWLLALIFAASLNFIDKKIVRIEQKVNQCQP